VWGAAGGGLFFGSRGFHAHVLHRRVLVSLQGSALGLVMSGKRCWG